MTLYQFLAQLLPFIILGAFTGTFAGLLGIGGGTVVVAGLLLIFNTGYFEVIQHPMHTAAATSLAVMIITTLSSFLTHWHLGSVHTPTYKAMVKGIFIGIIAGVSLSIYLPGTILEKIFAIILIVMSIYMFIKNGHTKNPRKKYEKDKVPPQLLAGVGGLIGVKSGLLGLGGGIITVPLLRHTHLKMRQAIGTSSAISLTIAITGTLAYLIIPHFINVSLLDNAYIYWPAVLGIGLSGIIFAPLGAWLSSRISTKSLTYIFAVLLLLIGIDRLFSKWLQSLMNF